jgi:hypothetical protein
MSAIPTQQQGHSLRYLQSEQEGQTEARKLLTEAAQQKGRPLTTTEIRTVYQERFQLYLKQVQEQAVADDQSSGWCAGFVGTCLDAERAAADPDGLWYTTRPLVPFWSISTGAEKMEVPMMQAERGGRTHVGRISLGAVALLFDDQEFVNGMEGGLEHCFSVAVPRHSVSTQELHHLLVETMIEDGQSEDGEEPSSTAFRSGFAFGWIMGRLHPTLHDMDERLTWIGALAMKYSGRCSAL